MRSITLRQESEHQGVQEAQMMQAMEFNSAWSQNMTEFERQAREIEDQCRQKHAEEFAEFQTKLQAKASRTYKFSRELLLMRKSVDTLAKQGRYNEAHKLKAKAQKLEEWERMKLDNEQEMTLAAKDSSSSNSSRCSSKRSSGGSRAAARSTRSTGSRAPSG